MEQNNQQRKSSTISITPFENQLSIKYSFRVFFKKSGDMVSCLIPSFDVAYSAPNIEIAKERAPKIMRMYMEFWIKKCSFKDFVMELHKRGFKGDEGALTLHKLLNNKFVKAKFKTNKDTLEGYDSSIENEVDELMEIA